MRRRLRIIGFEHRPKQPDLLLPERLRREGGGILRWAIEGCLEWQRAGLREPKAVKEATDSYFEAEDRIGQWMHECLETDAQSWVGTLELFSSWQSWAVRNNEYVGDTKRLKDQLEQRGCKPKRNSKPDRLGFRGLKILKGTKPAWLPPRE